MNWLDFILGGTLIGSTIAGFAKGLARTIIGMITAFLAIVLACWFYDVAGALFVEYTSSKAVANFAGFAAVFLIVMLAGVLTGRILVMIFKWAGLGWLDGLLGGLFGLARGLLISTVIVMGIMAFTTRPPPKAVVDSSIAPYVLDAARIAANLAPAELTNAVNNAYAKIKEVWNKAWQEGLKVEKER